MKIHAGFVSFISTVFLGSILFSTAALARSTPVTVVNPDTEPVPTKEAVPRQPWQRALTVTATEAGSFTYAGTQSVLVPADKRLVIETITMTAQSFTYLINFPEYLALLIPELKITTTVAGETVGYDFAVPEAFTTLIDCYAPGDCQNDKVFKAHINTRLYADPNTNVDATVTLRPRPIEGKGAFIKSTGFDFTVNLSGYLIPADSASLSP